MVETSVIIPTHNRLQFLQEAVASVMSQTYKDFELIIVDDGSSDGTAEFCSSHGRQMQYIFQQNRGPSAARNRGIDHAKGQFITFLDSDDLWQPKKLQTQIEFMQHHAPAMICYTDEIWIRKGVRVNQKHKHRKYSGWIFERCVPLCIVSPSSVLMRNRFFEEVGMFDETLPACEDYDLWLRASLHYPFHLINEKLIIKRGGHADQLSAMWGLDCYRVKALLKILNDPKLRQQSREIVIREVVRKCRILVQGLKKRDKNRQVRYYTKIIEDVSSDSNLSHYLNSDNNLSE